MNMNTNSNIPRHIVMSASTRGPAVKAFNGDRATNYRRVAVVEVAPSILAEMGATEPHAIDKRARGVNRIVRRWEGLYAGTTERCAYQCALADAHALADKLNQQER